MSIAFRMPKRLLAALLLAASPACAGPPESDPDMIAAAALREDFDRLYEGLKASHFDLYARRDKADYDRLHRKMRHQLRAPASHTQAEIFFQKFVAYGNVAHANIAFPSGAYEAYRAGGGKVLPLGVRFLGDAMMIADDWSGAAPSLAGARIVSIDGVGAAALEKRLSAHLSADNAYLARTMLEFRFAPLMWLEFGEADAFDVDVETPDGRRRTVVVPALARDNLATSTNPVFELDWDERRFEMIDGVGYLRPGPFYNNAPDAADMWDNAAFKTLIDEAFGAFIEKRAPAVIIDLRANPGGDNSFSDHMVAWFADRPFRFASHFYVKISEAAIASNAARLTPGDDASISARFAAAYAKAKIGDVIDFDLGAGTPRANGRYSGEVFMLIDRHSYSNTVTVAALAQDYGFATILGEETSDLATTYGAMEQFALPNTGISVGFPKAHIIRPNGSLDARGVIPDVAFASPLRPTRDTVLEEALAHVARALAAR